MNTLQGILIIIIFFVVTPFTLALAKLNGLSDFLQNLIIAVGIFICFAIALMRTEKH